MRIPNETLTQAARQVAENLGVRLRGEVIIDWNHDAYRLRIGMPGDHASVFHVALVPIRKDWTPQACIEAIEAAIDATVRRVDEERKRIPAWSPYPVGREAVLP